MNLRIAAFVLMTFCGLASNSVSAAGENQPVRMSVSMSPLSAPFFVALEKGYFTELGIDPIVTNVIGGHRAATALFSGDVDIATSSEAVVMFNSFKRSDFGVLCTFVSSDNDVKLLARKRSNIRSIKDMNGLRIGTVTGTSAQFFLDHSLMMSQGVQPDIEIIDLHPEEMESALASGSVDAIAIWEPIGYRAKKAMGDEVIEVSHDRLYTETFNAIVMNKFAERNPETMGNVLRALIKAAAFIAENRDAAQQIVTDHLKSDPEMIAAIWSDFDFTITLDQSLIASLEAEARWAMEKSLVDAPDIPNFLDYILIKPLERIQPQSVTVFR